MDSNKQQLILERCKEVVAKALELYGLDLSQVSILFNLRGRAAGMARRRNGHYSVRFNGDMINREAFNHIYNNTVPHEFAHIVCFMNPRLGENHDAGWARVCQALGGSGARRHNEAFVMGKGNTYEYITDRGHRVRIGDRHHNYIQCMSGTLTFRRGKGQINRTSVFSLVGVNGRSIAQPVAQNPHLTTAEAEEVLQLPKAPIAAKVPPTVNPFAVKGESKAATSRRIMLSGHTSGRSYEEIIAAMMAACGYDRQLARATYRANAAKVGVPVV